MTENKQQEESFQGWAKRIMPDRPLVENTDGTFTILNSPDKTSPEVMVIQNLNQRIKWMEEEAEQQHAKFEQQQAKFASWEEYQDHVEKLLLSIYGYLLRDIDEHQRRELRLRIIETRDGIYFGMEESDE